MSLPDDEELLRDVEVSEDPIHEVGGTKFRSPEEWARAADGTTVQCNGDDPRIVNSFKPLPRGESSDAVLDEINRRIKEVFGPQAKLAQVDGVKLGGIAPAVLSEGVKFDQDKLRTDLFSTSALLGLAAVLRYGANKYAADNWRKGMTWRRLTGAALRHLLAFQAGEDIDPESGHPHVDHAMCCLMFLSEFQKLKLGTDDRHKEV